MATKRYYVGNIPYDTDEQGIREFFKPHKLTDIKIVTDRDTGRPKGFAFIDVEDGDHQAVMFLSGTMFGNRTIKIDEARERAQGGGNGGGGRRNERGRSRGGDYER